MIFERIFAWRMLTFYAMTELADRIMSRMPEIFVCFNFTAECSVIPRALQEGLSGKDF